MINEKMKEALKQKMGKTINIEISVKNNEEEEKQKSSDLAPTVKDSDEPGVDKGEDCDEESDEAAKLQSMIDMQPKSPEAGKTLHGRAREKMLSKMAALKAKKDLKS